MARIKSALTPAAIAIASVGLSSSVDSSILPVGTGITVVDGGVGRCIDGVYVEV